MREVQPASLQCFQLELPGRTRYKRSQPRATSSSYSLLRSNSRSGIKSRTTSYTSSPRCASSHNCIAIDNSILPQDSQHILVGSALRRPHATGFSPLDYQTMPDVGKSPMQPYRSQSACTVYGYASRPVSAKQVETRHGKHTKSSLLRNKSTSCDSIASKTSSCSLTPTQSRPASGNKRLCQIRDDYRFFKKGPTHKQIPPNGESLHSFLTGARYNNTRYLDSRTLSKLGVYIPKADLKTFFVKEEPRVQYDDDRSDDEYNNYCDQNMPESAISEDSFSPGAAELPKPETQDQAINTEPHFLSIERWHTAEWHTDRKPTKQKAPRAHTAPSRFKPVTTLYHDYNTGHKYKYGAVS